jgi:hypothetical protein
MFLSKFVCQHSMPSDGHSRGKHFRDQYPLELACRSVPPSVYRQGSTPSDTSYSLHSPPPSHHHPPEMLGRLAARRLRPKTTPAAADTAAAYHSSAAVRAHGGGASSSALPDGLDRSSDAYARNAAAVGGLLSDLRSRVSQVRACVPPVSRFLDTFPC